MKRQRARIRKARAHERTVPFLPNFVTSIGLFFGFYSLNFSLKGQFYQAAIMIFLAAFIDAIDGRIARATNSTSAFGKEYDSLSDVICFGVAPAIMTFLWDLKVFGILGTSVCFIYVACGALRLARFNTDTSGDNSRFTGLPIPGAAVALASLVLISHELGPIPSVPLWDGWQLSLICCAVPFLAFLMVSTVKYPSFKHVDYIKAHPFQLLVGGIFLITIIAMRPEIMAFVLIMTFIFGGLLANIFAPLFARRKQGVNHDVPRENHHM